MRVKLSNCQREERGSVQYFLHLILLMVICIFGCTTVFGGASTYVKTKAYSSERTGGESSTNSDEAKAGDHRVLKEGVKDPRENRPAQQKESEPYLLLVSFYTKKSFTQINKKWIDIVNETPYNGVAVMVGGPYQANLTLDWVELHNALSKISQSCRKDIWPWVFFNRFIGGEKSKRAQHKLSDKQWSPFRDIPGVDIFDKHGSITDFKRIFTVALRIAKITGSPGIVVDQEAYNNPMANKMNYLENLTGMTFLEIKNHLKEIGNDLAKIVMEEYPTAILWFTSIKGTRSVDLIAEGILDTAISKGIGLKVVEGGMETVGYVHTSPKELDRRMSIQRKRLKDWLLRYPEHFCLAGTIAPTDRPSSRSKWIKSKYQGSNIQRIDDLKPVLVKLFNSYNFVWIYAASAARFNPFNPESSVNYHKVIAQALRINNEIRR